MKSGKTIDISKSSLISLKAELSRKQDEIRDIRSTHSYIKLPPKPKETIKKNSGIEQRIRKDTELNSEEIDLLKKSREVLAVKSKLYDELHKGNIVSNDKQHSYLVDFKNKEAPLDIQSCSSDIGTNATTEHDFKDLDIDEVSIDSTEVDDNEWIEYTDCLGRTRKCHKSDLNEMKEIDRKMAQETKCRDTAVKIEETTRERPPELVSSDMEREMFRKKWEDQERELLSKKDIHYEDVLFDEARAHGVGYFKFSQEEEKRHAEQEMLRKVREETKARQREARQLRERREAQRQARLIAARQRQRARLGLPPLSEQDILKDITSSTKVEEEKDEQIGPTPIEDLELKLLRAAHVRPWDKGKNKLEEPVMTQEEWIEKKRTERTSEFAPIYNKTIVEFDATKPPPYIKKRKIDNASSVRDKRDEELSVTSEEAIEEGLKYIRDQVERTMAVKK